MPYTVDASAKWIASNLAASLLATAMLVGAVEPSRSAPIDQKSLDAAERQELLRLRREVRELRRELGNRPSVEAQASARTVAAPSGRDPYPQAIDPKTLREAADLQLFYLRKEAIDAAYYLYPLTAVPDAKGASITMTRDELAGSTSLAVQAFASYVLFRPDLPGPVIPAGQSARDSAMILSGYAAAPFVYFNGSLGEPRKSSERSALQLGVDNQFEFAGGWLPLQTLRFRPYGQTDFRGLASIGGFNASYEPYLPELRLGANPNAGAQYIGFYFRTIAEADVFRVDNPGLTDFLPRTTYSFVGGTTEVNATLFQNMPEMGALCGRIHLNAQYQYFRDFSSNRDFRNFHSGVRVDVGGKPTPFCVLPGTVATPELGAMSVALTYDQGTDRTTLEDARKYQLQLTLKY